MNRHLSVVFLVPLIVLAAASIARGQSFSIDASSPEITVGVFGSVGPGTLQPGDVFTPLAAFGAVLPPVTPPALLNYTLISPGEVDALSFGRPRAKFSPIAPVVFSLDRGSSGVAGTASANEFNSGGGVSEQSSDVFRSVFNGTNTLFADGDGVVQPGNPNPAAFPLGTGEFPTFPFPPGPVPPVGGADLDAFDLRFNVTGAGSPTGRTFYSLDGASASPLGFTGGDVLVDLTGMGSPPAIYATEFQLGIVLPTPVPFANDIDALVVYDDGDNVFQPGTDIVMFSLAPGSPYLGQTDPQLPLTIEAGDVLLDAASAQAFLGTMPGTGAAILHTAESLGLRTNRSGSMASDNLNALDVVPEPATWLLLALVGLLVQVGRFNRKRH